MRPSLPHRLRTVAWRVALASLPAGVALAEGSDVAVRGLGGVEASPLATLLRLAGALLLVLLVFWGCASLVRRLQLGGAGLAGNARAGLRIVGALSLGSRERLVVVQAGEEQLLLGVTATRIERLHLLATPLAPPGGSGGGSGGGKADGETGGAEDFRSRLLAAVARRESA